MHDDAYFDLLLDDRVEFFNEQKSRFKKATKREAQKNKAHIDKLMRRKLLDNIELDNDDD